MKIRLKLKHRDKTRVFVGELKEEISECKCNNDCYEEQRKLWVKMMAPKGETYSKKIKSCYTCFFRGPDGGPDIGPHTTCLDCCRLNKWKERVNI